MPKVLCIDISLLPRDSDNNLITKLSALKEQGVKLVYFSQNNIERDQSNAAKKLGYPIADQLLTMGDLVGGMNEFLKELGEEGKANCHFIMANNEQSNQQIALLSEAGYKSVMSTTSKDLADMVAAVVTSLTEVKKNRKIIEPDDEPDLNDMVKDKVVKDDKAEEKETPSNKRFLFYAIGVTSMALLFGAIAVAILLATGGAASPLAVLAGFLGINLALSGVALIGATFGIGALTGGIFAGLGAVAYEAGFFSGIAKIFKRTDDEVNNIFRNPEDEGYQKLEEENEIELDLDLSKDFNVSQNGQRHIIPSMTKHLLNRNEAQKPKLYIDAVLLLQIDDSKKFEDVLAKLEAIHKSGMTVILVGDKDYFQPLNQKGLPYDSEINFMLRANLSSQMKEADIKMTTDSMQGKDLLTEVDKLTQPSTENRLKHN